MTHQFSAMIDIIGINPFVSVPENVLQQIFIKAGKDKGHIPVKGTVNRKAFTQTLVRYSGAWRLYINTAMLKDSPKRIGETIALQLAFDPADRTIAIHPALAAALNKNKKARTVFEGLPPSRRKEIVRYIMALKTPATVEKNVDKAINFLLGKERFVGRDKP